MPGSLGNVLHAVRIPGLPRSPSRSAGAPARLLAPGGGPPVTLACMPGQDVMALAFQPTGRWLAATGGSDWIKLWPWEELLAAARRQGKKPEARRTPRAPAKNRKS